MDVFVKTLIGSIAVAALAACAPTADSILGINDTNSSNSASGDCSSAVGTQSTKLDNRYIVHWNDGTFSVESAANDDEFTQHFIKRNGKSIVRVEHDWVVHTQQARTQQAQASSVNSWGQQMINASALWNQGITGQGVTVAVVDTEIDTTHPQLAGQIAVNTGEIPNNGVDDDSNGYVDDYLGKSFVSAQTGSQLNEHATHVSGIIAADPSKGSVQGVAPGAKILPASFLANDGSGSIGDAVVAMQFAGARGAKIINASWGGAPCVSSLQAMFNQLSARGVLLVVAAGNDGRNLDQYQDFPASFNVATQLTIAASNSNDIMASFSNFGFSSVNLAAPGVNIISTVPGGGTASLDGTSMAAPFVSGAAALLWSAHPNATAAQIKTAILRGVDIVTGMSVSTGGRLDVQKAYQELLKLVP